MSKVRFLYQVSQLLRRDVRLNFKMPSNVLQQLQHSRHLSLREEVDLQVEMTPLVGLAREPVLAGQNDQGQEDRLE